MFLNTEMVPLLYLKEILNVQDLYFSMNVHSRPSSVDEDHETQLKGPEKLNILDLYLSV